MQAAKKVKMPFPVDAPKVAVAGITLKSIVVKGAKPRLDCVIDWLR